MMPVTNLSTHVNADAMFSSRPNVAFPILISPEIIGLTGYPASINRFEIYLNIQRILLKKIPVKNGGVDERGV
jgi:hypothetical protein